MILSSFSSISVLFWAVILLLFMRVWARDWWRTIAVPFLSVALFMALAIEIRTNTSIGVSDDSLFNFDGVSQLLIIVVLFFSLINFINTVLTDKKLHFEILALSAIVCFLTTALLAAESVVIYVLLLPFLVIALGFLPLVYNLKIGRRAAKKALVYAICLLVFWIGISATWVHEAQSLYLEEINRGLFDKKMRYPLFIGWVLGLFSFMTLMFYSPFQLFSREYELTLTWSQFSFFRWLSTLAGASLMIKWTYALTSWRVGSQYEWVQVFGFQTNELLFFFLIAIFVWNAFYSFRTRTLHEYLSVLMYVPLFFGSAAILTGHLGGMAWGFVSFTAYALASVLISGSMFHSVIPLNIGLNKFKGFTAWDLRLGSTWLFLVLLFLLPMGNQVYFSLSRDLVPYWFVDGLQEPSLVTLVFACSLLSIVFFWRSAKLFQGSTSVQRSTGQGVSFLWHYILLIPFIILGIYPFPLYNYVKLVLLARL